MKIITEAKRTVSFPYTKNGFKLISYPQPGIMCLDCGRTSYSLGDIKHKYCANCNKFHEIK